MPERRQVEEIKTRLGMGQTPGTAVRVQLEEVRPVFGWPAAPPGGVYDFRAEWKAMRAFLGMSLVDSNPASVVMTPGF